MVGMRCGDEEWKTLGMAGVYIRGWTRVEREGRKRMEINKEEGRRKESVTFSSFSFALSLSASAWDVFCLVKVIPSKGNSGVHNTPLLCLTGPVSRKQKCKFKWNVNVNSNANENENSNSNVDRCLSFFFKKKIADSSWRERERRWWGPLTNPLTQMSYNSIPTASTGFSFTCAPPPPGWIVRAFSSFQYYHYIFSFCFSKKIMLLDFCGTRLRSVFVFFSFGLFCVFFFF